MNVLVLGAGGATGKQVVEKAVAAGHTVTAFVHAAGAELPASVRLVTGDASDEASVRSAVSGQDAVIDAIGGKTPYKDTDLERKAVANVITAMKAEGATRLVVVSMLGIGESEQDTPWWYRYLIQPTFLRGAGKDKTAMEAEVNASGLEFVIVRPPFLKDDPATGSWIVDEPEHESLSITREDLAAFLVEQLTSNEHTGRAVTVSNSK